MLMSQGVPALGSIKQGWGVKTSYFRAKCVGDGCIITTRFTPRTMTLDDLELL